MPAGSGAGHPRPHQRRLGDSVELADVTEGDERRSVPLRWVPSLGDRTAAVDGVGTTHTKAKVSKWTGQAVM
jgi:hypothetical protein